MVGGPRVEFGVQTEGMGFWLQIVGAGRGGHGKPNPRVSSGREGHFRVGPVCSPWVREGGRRGTARTPQNMVGSPRSGRGRVQLEQEKAHSAVRAAVDDACHAGGHAARTLSFAYQLLGQCTEHATRKRRGREYSGTRGAPWTVRERPSVLWPARARRRICMRALGSTCAISDVTTIGSTMRATKRWDGSEHSGSWAAGWVDRVSATLTAGRLLRSERPDSQQHAADARCCQNPLFMAFRGSV